MSERKLHCRFPDVEAAARRLSPRPWLAIHGEKDTYIGPDGLGEGRGRPTIVGRSGAARDEETARRLWELSEELTGVAFPLSPAVARPLVARGMTA